MPVTSQQISDSAGILLQDVSATRWPAAERLAWINDGRRQMAELKPEIFGADTEVTHTLTTGARQRLATTGALRLVSVDSHGGNAVLPTMRQALDSFRPGWRDETARAVDNWFPDETDRLAFWIHPGSTGELRCHVLLMPADLTALSDVALPFDIHKPHLINYVCYRALAKEDEAASIEKAAAYLKLFIDGLS
jgi:hypothetical protein